MKDSASRIFAILSTIFVFGIIIGYFTEFRHIDSSPGVSRLVLSSLVIAIAAGWLTAFFTIKSRPNTIEKTRNSLFVILAFVLVIPLLSLKTNRWFAEKEAHIETFTFISQKPVLSKPFGQLKFENLEPSFYIASLEQNGKSLTIKTSQKWISNAQTGSQVYLPVRKGLWGINIVDVNGLKADAN